jgi:hypothetical protein
MTQKLENLLAANLELRARMARAESVSERIRVISDAPMYSFWTEVKDELKQAADTIERLEARIRALEGEDA